MLLVWLCGGTDIVTPVLMRILFVVKQQTIPREEMKFCKRKESPPLPPTTGHKCCDTHSPIQKYGSQRPHSKVRFTEAPFKSTVHRGPIQKYGSQRPHSKVRFTEAPFKSTVHRGPIQKYGSQGDLKIALQGGGGGVTWTPAEGGGGAVGEMGFRVGPFVLCKNGCWCRRRRNTNFGPKKFFPPIIPPPPHI